jgi:hypothetical protein
VVVLAERAADAFLRGTISRRPVADLLKTLMRGRGRWTQAVEGEIHRIPPKLVSACASTIFSGMSNLWLIFVRNRNLVPAH